MQIKIQQANSPTGLDYPLYISALYKTYPCYSNLQIEKQVSRNEGDEATVVFNFRAAAYFDLLLYYIISILLEPCPAKSTHPVSNRCRRRHRRAAERDCHRALIMLPNGFLNVRGSQIVGSDGAGTSKKDR
jgi:hypothetical protein